MPRELTVCAVLMIAGLNVASGQKVQPEIRLDVLGPRTPSIEPGVGVNVALGYYVRLGIAGGFNVRRGDALNGSSWRGDVLARFTFDPFRQQRWALSVGGGLSFRRQTYLAAVADLEGPETHGFVAAIQAGVSGGPRGAVILRRAVRGRR